MRFEPKSEEQIQREGLFPKGEYAFEVLEAKDKTSKAGNDMIEVKIRVFSNDDESSQIVFDYLMEKTAYKLRHFCSNVGLIQKYNAGTLQAQDCLNKTGVCLLIVKEDPSGQYQPKNAIQDYLVRESSEVTTEAVNKATKLVSKTKVDNDMAEDDIPF